MAREYSETEQRNLRVVRQFLGEEEGPVDKTELFAEDGVWWNGLPLIGGAEGRTEHRGRAEIAELLPSRKDPNATLPPGQDIYDMPTVTSDDHVTIVDGDWVVRQQTIRAKTKLGKDYANTYAFVFRFNESGEIAYLTEHWNTWHAHNVLFNNFTMEPAHPEG